MIIQLCIYLVVFLIAIYYITVCLHLFGLKIFSTDEISGLAFFPLFCWFKREKKESKIDSELSFEEKLKKAEDAVEIAKKEVESLTSDADQESNDAKKKLARAKKIYKKSKENLDLLRKTNF